jgi:hypothetical protein
VGLKLLRDAPGGSVLLLQEVAERMVRRTLPGEVARRLGFVAAFAGTGPGFTTRDSHPLIVIPSEVQIRYLKRYDLGSRTRTGFAHARINPRLTRYEEDRNALLRVRSASRGTKREINYNVQIARCLSTRPNRSELKLTLD